MIRSIRDTGLTPIITLNHLTLPLWVLTPPIQFAKKIDRSLGSLIPTALAEVPLSDPISDDPFWNSLQGWENNRTVNEFVGFVEFVVQELKDLVDYWVTVSEPVAAVLYMGYIAGLWPPGFIFDASRAKKALHNLILAHVLAYDKISILDDVDADEDGVSKFVGFSHLMMEVAASSQNGGGGSGDDAINATCTPANEDPKGIIVNVNTEAARNFGYFVNDYFLNAVIKGEEDLNYLETLQRHNKDSPNFILHNDWKNKTDFIGIDYYRRVYAQYDGVLASSPVKFLGGMMIESSLGSNNNNNNNNNSDDKRPPAKLLNDLGWEVFPEGLYNLLIHVKENWGNNIPILITENGIADRYDRYRAPFIVAHIKQVKRAIDNGDVNVIGYLHWSFLDNYEWLEGYRPEAKFGLFTIDFDTRNKGTSGTYDSSNDIKAPRRNDLDKGFYLNRQKTKGAEAMELIIKGLLDQRKGGKISDDAILAAKRRFGTLV
jgi:beta-glucosidase